MSINDILLCYHIIPCIYLWVSIARPLEFTNHNYYDLYLTSVMATMSLFLFLIPAIIFYVAFCLTNHESIVKSKSKKGFQNV